MENYNVRLTKFLQKDQRRLGIGSGEFGPSLDCFPKETISTMEAFMCLCVYGCYFLTYRHFCVCTHVNVVV